MGRLIHFYRPDGTAIDNGDESQDTLEWGVLHELYYRVAESTIGHYWVSTVYIGIDHSFGFGPPLIFETMVFDENTERALANDEYMDRYPTWQQALEGHQNVAGALAAIEGVPAVTNIGERPGS